MLIAAANFSNLPTEVIQPDGSVLSLYASGDEFANRLHDAEGYSVIQSKDDGYYYYAVLQKGEPAPSAHRADSSDPIALGLVPGITVSQATYNARVQFMNSHNRDGHRAPNTGTVNNVVVYIRFSDQTEFDEPRSSYDSKFNAMGDDQYSLRNYFHQVSYDQLNYVSHHYPTCAPDINLSYQDSHPRAYYMPYNSITNPQGYRDWQRTEREQTLLANSIAAIASQVPAELNIDADNDGYVDNVCFIIRGPHTAWADLLWAHRWALYAEDAYINGKMVWDFTFQPENQNTVRTLCHEMFHSVGAPDLYHYEFDGITPAGCWDIMESGYGHMGMYMKYKYGGWLDSIPEIGVGTHTLNPITSTTNNAYKLHLSGNTYLVFEYRKRGTDIFEDYLPGSGLIIYRIVETGEGNADGPPDEVYVYRPNGTVSANGLIASAAFSTQNSQTEFNTQTNPSCFMIDGSTWPVNIKNISSAGEVISFTVDSTQGTYPPVISNVTPAEGAMLTLGDQVFSASASVPNSSVGYVEFRCDGTLVATDETAPYSCQVPASLLPAGYHQMQVTAYSQLGEASSKSTYFRVVDPLQQTWFSWLSGEPVWEEYGRGAVPIQAALILDLGTQDYVVKKFALNAIADTWGIPDVPGLITAKINRFSGGAITDITLLDLGSLSHPMNGRQEFTINSDIPLSGEIAVIVNLFEYQNIVFDTNAPCGHTLLTEPDRPWTDALGRGILGSAGIELLLQAPYVSNEDSVSEALVSSLRNWPNPFRRGTSLSFDLKVPRNVTLAIYNVKGQKIRVLIADELSAGNHQIEWDGRDGGGSMVAPGIYFSRLATEDQAVTRRMVIVGN